MYWKLQCAIFDGNYILVIFNLPLSATLCVLVYIIQGISMFKLLQSFKLNGFYLYVSFFVVSTVNFTATKISICKHAN